MENIQRTNGFINVITEIGGEKIVLINEFAKLCGWQLKVYIFRFMDTSVPRNSATVLSSNCAWRLVFAKDRRVSRPFSWNIYTFSCQSQSFANTKDTVRLKGANKKVKANIAPAIGELIQIATNKANYPDYGNKHKSKAKYGWYRFAKINRIFFIPAHRVQTRCS